MHISQVAHILRTSTRPVTTLAPPEFVAAIKASIPRHLAHVFLVSASHAGFVRVDHNARVSRSEEVEHLHDTRLALEALGYRVAPTYGALCVFPAIQVEEHCERCGAPTPPACECHDEVTE